MRTRTRTSRCQSEELGTALLHFYTRFRPLAVGKGSGTLVRAHPGVNVYLTENVKEKVCIKHSKWVSKVFGEAKARDWRWRAQVQVLFTSWGCLSNNGNNDLCKSVCEFLKRETKDL